MRILIITALSVFLLACASAAKKDEAYKIAQSNVQLGIGYLKQGRVEDALIKLQKAVDVAPAYPEAQSSIALVYQQLGEFEKSREHYEKALELQPDSGIIHNNFATLLCRSGKPLEAETHFLKAIKSRGYKTPAQALENLGACMMQVPDLEKAEKYLRQALQMNPKLPSALLQMARIGLEKKRYMSGRAYLQRYQEVAEMNPESLWVGIQVEKQLGDKKAVMDFENQLRRKFPDSNETRLLLEAMSGNKAK